MNAQQLRNSILQEAIEGRLVPQDPNDEPASALLERIRKEKERLVKEGKLKKKDLEVKPISEDEIPFEIPESWEWVRFSDLYWQLTDGTHSTPKYTTSGIPFLSVKDMSSGKLSFTNTKYISPEEHSILSQRCHPQKGDLLLSKVGTTGVPLIIDTEKEFSIFVSLALIKFFPDLIDSRFLLYLINSPLVQLQAADNTRGVGNKNWVLKAISDTIMVLPPLAEQQRIVAKIEELLPKVEEYGKAQDALDKLNKELPERLKKSILQEAISGRLVPQDPNDEPASVLLDKIRKEKEQLVKAGKLKKKDLIETPITDDEIPFEIPESWEWVRLGSISKLLGGFAFKSHEYCSEGSRVIRISDISEEGFVNKNIVRHPYNKNLDQYVICSKDILMAMTGGTVGKSLFVKTLPEEKMLTNQRVAVIRCYNVIVDNIDYVVKSESIQSVISDAKNSTNDNISMADIYNFLIPLPPLAEQHRIVEKLEQLLGEIDKLKIK